jgi:hypothetical protein
VDRSRRSEQHPLTLLEARAPEQTAHALERTVGDLAARTKDLAPRFAKHPHHPKRVALKGYLWIKARKKRGKGVSQPSRK